MRTKPPILRIIFQSLPIASLCHEEYLASGRWTARGSKRPSDRPVMVPLFVLLFSLHTIAASVYNGDVAGRSVLQIAPNATVGQVAPLCSSNKCICAIAKDLAPHVNCSHLNLKEVPQDIGPLTVMLELSYNNISTIPERSFETLVNLRELYLNSNQIRRLPRNSFHKMRHLKHLRLDDNELSEIPITTFAELSHLETLNLARNDIKEMPDFAFQNLSQLYVLYLNSNQIRRLPRNSFHNTRRLKHLRLDDNELSEIPTAALAELSHLETLNLARNNIKEIPDFAFQNLSKLRVLDLRDNKIAEVGSFAFYGLTSIEYLKIDDNKLAVLPSAISALPHLHELTFTDNSISFIPDRAFYNNSHLNTIEMRGNPIEDIGKSAFANLPSLRSLTLSDARLLKTFPELTGTAALKHLGLDRAQIHTVPSDLCSKVPELQSLNLKSNRLSTIPELGECTELGMIDLSYNFIEAIEGSPFYGQKKLVNLHLGNNLIKMISEDAFKGLESLKVLDLVNNQIEDIHPEAFVPLTNLQDLNLGGNQFPRLPTKGLDKLHQLKTFNNRNLKEFPPPESFPLVHTLALSYAYHCCAFSSQTLKKKNLKDSIIWIRPGDEVDLSIWNNSDTYSNISQIPPEILKNFATGQEYISPDNFAQYADEYSSDYKTFYNSEENILSGFPIKCLPQPGPFMPCEDLFGWWTLRCGIWIVFLLAMLGNGIVVIVLLFGRSKMDVPRFLVCNLAIADFFMGIYLGILAVVDASTLGEFKVFAIRWQTSTGCQIAGFLGVLSSELSVYTLSVITLERNYAITHAMHLNKRLSLRHAGYIMVCGWSFALIMAILPLFGISDYRKFAICLPFEIEDSWSMGYVVFLILINGVAFLILMGCYLKMYCAIRGSQAWNSNDSRIAKRMALLVFTDFICWAPIAFFSLTAVFGLHLISLEEAKVFTIFVLPLNSCANPFLYAIFTKQFKKDCVLLCKRIEESRVTRGIGRCRHSSNFSNRHTPVNTNSAAERKSGGEQPLCQCRNHKAAEDGGLLNQRRSWKTWAMRYLFCQEDDCEPESNDYTYAIAQIQRNVERGHKRASSISSENFSSRSDSWRQGNIPLRLLERATGGGGGGGTGRKNSWSITRKPSQDSSMSCSRQDSSTSTFRMSRSSVSSDTSNATSRAGFSSIRDRQYLSANAEGGQPTRSAFGSIREKPLNGEPGARFVRGLTRDKPQLCRQGAVDDNNLPRVMYRGTEVRPFQRSPPFGIPRTEGLCPTCAKKDTSPPLVFKSKELEEKFNCFYNRLAETSHEDSSEISLSKEEQVILSSESMGEYKQDLITEEPQQCNDDREKVNRNVPLQPHIEIAPQSPMMKKTDQQNEKVMSWLQQEEENTEEARGSSRESCTHLQVSMDSMQDPHHLHVSADNIPGGKSYSMTNIGSELSSGRKVASDNSIKKLSLRSLPAIFRSLSSQSTQHKGERKLKVMSQTQLRPKSAEQLPCSMSETIIHRKTDFPPEWYKRRMHELLKGRMPEDSDSDDDNVFVEMKGSKTDSHISRGVIEVHRLVKSQPSGGSNNEEIPLIDADVQQQNRET